MVKYVKRMVPRWRIRHATSFKSVLRQGRAHAPADVSLRHRDIAFLQYTGGTTGVAKGAVLTHGNLVANLQQVSAWIGRDLEDGKEIAVLPLPLYHVYALTCNLVFVKIGAQTTLITNPRDIPAFIAELRKSPFSIIDRRQYALQRVVERCGISPTSPCSAQARDGGRNGGAACRGRKWKEVTGVPLVEGYGLTETSPVAISNPLNIKEWNGTIGLPIPSTEAAIFDEDGKEVPAGELGEICVRGPQVMKSYWKSPARPRRSLRATVGFALATWASWMRMAISSSPIARRT